MNDDGFTTQRIKAIIQEKYDTFVRIFIHHVYKCNLCNRYWASKNLKKVDDKRVCPICAKEVSDVTFTPEGEVWRAFTRPDLEILEDDVHKTGKV